MHILVNNKSIEKILPSIVLSLRAQVAIDLQMSWLCCYFDRSNPNGPPNSTPWACEIVMIKNLKLLAYMTKYHYRYTDRGTNN